MKLDKLLKKNLNIVIVAVAILVVASLFLSTYHVASIIQESQNGTTNITFTPGPMGASDIALVQSFTPDKNTLVSFSLLVDPDEALMGTQNGFLYYGLTDNIEGWFAARYAHTSFTFKNSGQIVLDMSAVPVWVTHTLGIDVPLTKHYLVFWLQSGTSALPIYRSSTDTYTSGSMYIADYTQLITYTGDAAFRVVTDSSTQPIASFTYTPLAPTTGTEVTFDGTTSKDAAEYRWMIESVWSDWSTSKTIKHIFTTPGAETVVLGIKNSAGVTDQETGSITISGEVVDTYTLTVTTKDTSGNLLPSANVLLSGRTNVSSDATTATVVFNNVDPGMYTIKVFRTGYDTYKTSVGITNANVEIVSSSVKTQDDLPDFFGDINILALIIAIAVALVGVALFFILKSPIKVRVVLMIFLIVIGVVLYFMLDLLGVTL